MTTKEFATRMNRVLENAKYFSMIGYHCTLDFSIETEKCCLTVFFGDDKDVDFITGSSDLVAKVQIGDYSKWITLS